MFTIPATGSGSILVARPSASSGTITSAASAYDLPSSRPDDPPYTTSADVALVTGSTVAGTPDYATVEYNTFTARSKTNFSQCQLSIGISTSLIATSITASTGSGTYTTPFVTSSISVDYQIDGTNWVNIKTYAVDVLASGTPTYVSLGPASNSSNAVTSIFWNAGRPSQTDTTKETLSVTIPSSLFPSNLSSLKVRFVLGTCKNNVVTSYQSSGSYQVWDIRANIS